MIMTRPFVLQQGKSSGATISNKITYDGLNQIIYAKTKITVKKILKYPKTRTNRLKEETTANEKDS